MCQNAGFTTRGGQSLDPTKVDPLHFAEKQLPGGGKAR
jgi:hypothetical protein